MLPHCHFIHYNSEYQLKPLLNMLTTINASLMILYAKNVGFMLSDCKIRHKEKRALLTVGE